MAIRSEMKGSLPHESNGRLLLREEPRVAFGFLLGPILEKWVPLLIEQPIAHRRVRRRVLMLAVRRLIATDPGRVAYHKVKLPRCVHRGAEEVFRQYHRAPRCRAPGV